jgi:parvulin-like peptidyl-prolyl isomerase
MGRERKIKKLRREGILEPVKIDKKRASALKKIFLWTTSLLLSFVFVFGTWAYIAKDTQASVNGSRIMTRDVDAMLEPVKRSMRDQGQNPDDKEQAVTINQYKSEIVEMLIDSKLFEQYAKNNNMNVSEEEVEAKIDEEINKIIASYESEEAFTKTLAGSELRTIERLREEIRKSLKPQMLEEKILDPMFSEIKITEEDAKTFFNAPAAIQAQRLLLQLNFETANEEEIQKRETELRDIREKLLNEEITFDKAIETHSEDEASKPNQGSVTLQEASPPNEPELFQTASSMSIGEISSIIKTMHGFSLVKVNSISYNKEGYDVPESASIKAITLKSEEAAPIDPLNEAAPSAEEKAKGLVKTLRDGKEKFDTIADLFAVSPEMSKQAQTVYRGQMEPVKEAAIFDQLKPNEFSDPIPSANTFEIIQLISKSPAKKAIFSELKDQIIEEITMRKKGEIRNNWIQEQREKAKISRSNAWIRITDFYQASFGAFFEDLGNWIRHYTVDPKPAPSPTDTENMPFTFPGDSADFDETFTIPVEAEDVP